jgi:hypothetical protein
METYLSGLCYGRHMATKVFDRETLLDLTVNFIPLFIILFFIVGYAVYDPFGIDSVSRILQYALLVTPFVLLAILTYLSGKAIATAEKTSPVYLPGGATVDGAEPVEEHDEE